MFSVPSVAAEDGRRTRETLAFWISREEGRTALREGRGAVDAAGRPLTSERRIGQSSISANTCLRPQVIDASKTTMDSSATDAICFHVSEERGPRSLWETNRNRLW